MLSSGFLRPLGQVWIVTGLFLLIVAIITAMFDLIEAVPAYLVSAALSVFFGSLIWVATRRQKWRSTIADVSAFVFLAWVTTPLFLVPAFMQLDPGFTRMDALFESYSAFSTTGAILLSPEDAGRGMVLLRCCLSFLGGYATLLFAAGLLAAFDRSGPRMRKSVLLTHDADDVFSNLGLAARRVFIVYGGVTAFVFLALAIAGTGLFDAACLSLSAISTGGYASQSGALSDFVPGFGILIVALACFIGAMNIAYLRDLTSKNSQKSDPDLTGLAILTGLIFALFMITSEFSASIPTSLAEAIFSTTTAGFHASDSAGFIPLAAIFAALVGGSAASTSGGLKISRLVLLWNQTFAELARLADPSTITSLKFRGGDTGEAALIALWSTILAFIATLAITMLLLGALGAPLGQAWSGAATALSNSGPLYERMGADFLWSDFGPISQGVLITAMILGRLEVLAGGAAIIALFSRDG